MAVVPEEIDYEEIKLKAVIGKGSYGVVWRGEWKDTLVAVKHVETEIETFRREVSHLIRVQHPNIVTIYGVCTGFELYLVMELACGSLFEFLHGTERPEYNLAHALSWTLQCAKGVAYLHSFKPKPIIHRDLKPLNLLLKDRCLTCKICDFGTAVDAKTYMTNNKGSAAWMAPEVFEGVHYGEKCDVFSFGVIIWEVLTRRRPFHEVGGPALRILWMVHQGSRPPPVRDCPAVLQDLFMRCWEKEPDKRPHMEQCVQVLQYLFKFIDKKATAIDWIQPTLPSSRSTSSHDQLFLGSGKSTRSSKDKDVAASLDSSWSGVKASLDVDSLDIRYSRSSSSSSRSTLKLEEDNVLSPYEQLVSAEKEKFSEEVCASSGKKPLEALSINVSDETSVDGDRNEDIPVFYAKTCDIVDSEPRTPETEQTDIVHVAPIREQDLAWHQPRPIKIESRNASSASPSSNNNAASQASNSGACDEGFFSAAEMTNKSSANAPNALKNQSLPDLFSASNNRAPLAPTKPIRRHRTGLTFRVTDPESPPAEYDDAYLSQGQSAEGFNISVPIPFPKPRIRAYFEPASNGASVTGQTPVYTSVWESGHPPPTESASINFNQNNCPQYQPRFFRLSSNDDAQWTMEMPSHSSAYRAAPPSYSQPRHQQVYKCTSSPTPSIHINLGAPRNNNIRGQVRDFNSPQHNMYRQTFRIPLSSTHHRTPSPRIYQAGGAMHPSSNPMNRVPQVRIYSSSNNANSNNSNPSPATVTSPATHQNFMRNPMFSNFSSSYDEIPRQFLHNPRSSGYCSDENHSPDYNKQFNRP